MTESYDVAVIGLGAMGSASLWQFARRGLRVVGIDRFSPPHDQGSTHGETRITRQAIGEGASYVPLALRSHEIWREVEAQTGECLLFEVGGLTISHAGQSDTPKRHGNFLTQAINAAERYGIAHEVLTPADIRQRYPQFRPETDELGLFEPGAGYLLAEKCVAANLGLARAAGADLKLSTVVRGLEPGNMGIRLDTDRGSLVAQKLIVAAGPWAPALLGEPFTSILTPTRQLMHWLNFDPEWKADWTTSPVFMWLHEDTRKGFFYGFPSRDGTTIKCADEIGTSRIDPDAMQREIRPAAQANFVASHLEGRLQGIAGVSTSVSCIYTETPDSHFLIDWHPKLENCLVVSPCSGHGFKHAAAIGEAVAQLLTDGRSNINLIPFALGRFGLQGE